MIRINLLSPADAKKKRRQLSSSSAYGAIFALVLVLEILGLYYWGDSKQALVDEKTKTIQRIEQEVATFQALKQQQEDLQAKIQEEQRQTEIFAKIQAARVGPANMLLYLSYMLTRPPLENREERVIQEQLGWNTGWDTERAWFRDVRKSGEKTLDITGTTLTHKDTDELLKRLRNCAYFQNLRLIRSTRGSYQGHDSIDFQFSMDLNYEAVLPPPEVLPEPGKQAAADPGGRG